MLVKKTPPEPKAFTLMELLVVMAVLSILLTGISMIFVETSRVARVQTEQAAMQQNQRAVHHEIGRFLRMTGVGGLPITWTRAKVGFTPDYTTVGSFPNGFAVGLENNVATGTRMPDTVDGGGGGGGGGDDTRDWVMPGTDVVTVRGVFTTPVYYLLDSVDVEAAIVSDEIPQLTIDVPSRIGKTNYDVPLTPLVDRVQAAIDSNRTLPFIVRDLTNPDAYFIMELNAATTDLNLKDCLAGEVPDSWPDDEAALEGTFWCVQLGLRFIQSSDYTQPWGNLSMGNNLEINSGSLSVNMPTGSTRSTLQIPKTIGSIGLLEEFRFYLRADWEVPGETSSRITPVFSRAEFVPGTDELLDTVDIARDIIEFQVAAGIENNSEIGVTGFNDITDTGGGDDEILFNSPDDVLVEPQVLKDAGLDPAEYYNPELDYHFLRINTMAQLSSPTRNQWVPRLSFIEDHNMAQTHEIDGVSYNFNSDRNVPHRYLQTVIELRNLR